MVMNVCFGLLLRRDSLHNGRYSSPSGPTAVTPASIGAMPASNSAIGAGLQHPAANTSVHLPIAAYQPESSLYIGRHLDRQLTT